MGVSKTIPVVAVNTESGKQYRFGSIKECANTLEISETGIQNCLNKRWKQTKGYTFIKESEIPEELVFIWIGSKAHQVDKIAPVLGYNLSKKYKLRNMFVDGSNIKETVKMCNDLKKDKTRKFKFIAIDVGFCNSKALMLRVDGGIRPSSGVRKQELVIGDIGFVINIDNVYSHIKHLSKQTCLELNIVDHKVIKKTNKLISRMYSKLDSLMRSLGGV